MNYTGFRHVSRAMQALCAYGARTATVYLAPDLVVRATRRLYRRRRFSKAAFEAVVTIGRPNYLERRFIAKAKKAGASFPVRKVQVKAPPKPKKGRRRAP